MSDRYTSRAILEQLEREQLLNSKDMPKIRAQLAAQPTPWYIQAISAVGGLLAASLMLCFVGMIGLLDEPIVGLMLGGILSSGALLMRRQKSSYQGMLQQGLLTLSLVGQGLILYSIEKLTGDGTIVLISYILLAIPLYFADRERLHRVIVSALAFHALWMLVLVELDSPILGYLVFAGLVALATGVLSDRLPPAAKLRDQLKPAAFSAILAIFSGALFSLGERSGDVLAFVELPNRIIVAVAFGIVLGLAAQEADGEDREPAKWAAGFAALMALISNVGILASLLVLALGFWRHHRALIVAGSLSLVGFVIHFYYDLHMDLLTKSGVLVGSGLALLGLREMLRRQEWMQRWLDQHDASERNSKEQPPEDHARSKPGDDDILRDLEEVQR